ncbi:hypothetical protein [uncultured Clostridium sp.]|uniref:hypothetical protein n=1 Tax=uncultured Clostridium sp. TaxID=59620 RepID=UPI0025DCCE8F|nr:hypothetical protein [uncultured Clostridium sp.]
MKSERIGLRFSRKDDDIVSWILMLRENKIEQSFAVKALLKAFFLNEHINGGTVKMRHNVSMEPTSIDINESLLNKDIMNIKAQGMKLASFTKDIIRLFICIGNEDECPDYCELQNIHTRYKIRYLNSLLRDNVIESAVSIDKQHIEKENTVRDLKTLDNNNAKVTQDEKLDNMPERRDSFSEAVKINKHSELDMISSERSNQDQLGNLSDKNQDDKPKIKKRNPLLAQI